MRNSISSMAKKYTYHTMRFDTPLLPKSMAGLLRKYARVWGLDKDAHMPEEDVRNAILFAREQIEDRFNYDYNGLIDLDTNTIRIPLMGGLTPEGISDDKKYRLEKRGLFLDDRGKTLAHIKRSLPKIIREYTNVAIMESAGGIVSNMNAFGVKDDPEQR